MYADDTQPYVTFTPSKSEEEPTMDRLIKGLDEVETWMSSNKLKLNAGKTEYMVVARKRDRVRCNIPDLLVSGSVVQPVTKVRNLGSVFDQEMSMVEHIAAICKSGYYHLHNIALIRKYLDKDSLTTVIHAFVTSRLDYSNCLLYGLPKSKLRRLQLLQNSAARLIAGTSRRESITPVLQQLHWLPVEQRIKFKVILFVYKALHGSAPDYIAALLQEHRPCRMLRSSESRLLTQHPYRLVTAGGRAFQICAPKLWNSLPRDIRDSTSKDILKSRLKAFLFKEAFIASL
jgi:hypothetical protein